jgi:D-glycero-D-manno-heptose 1,7-bisphosphate phosphatase
LGKNKAVFLDRDGTVNVEKGYICKPEDFVLIDGAASAIAKMKRLGFKVLVVTNQSGIGRGYYGEDDLSALHIYMNELLAMEEASVDAVYYCPHHPEAVLPEYRLDCDCRKPKTGLFRKAIADFDIDPTSSWAVGDSPRDLAPARELGMRTALVLTGHGKAGEQGQADIEVENLVQFGEFIDRQEL